MKRLFCAVMCALMLFMCSCTSMADMVIESAVKETVLDAIGEDAKYLPDPDDWDDEEVWEDWLDDQDEKDWEDAWEDKWEQDREDLYDKVRPSEPSPAPSPTPTPDPNELGFEVADGAEPLEIETYLGSDWLKYYYVYDSEYLHLIFGDEKITGDDVKRVVKNNPGIGDKYEDFVLGFIDDFVSTWPEADLRVMHHNFKTLEIIECNEQEMMLASLSTTAYGCYVRSENHIYIMEGELPGKKTWDYQVIYHELCHAARTLDGEIDGIKVGYTTGLYFLYVTCDEALNSLFAVSLFDYDEPDVAYQLQSNYYGALIDSMPNYSLGDYMNHSGSYFASKLDELTGHTNYASVMIQLMEAWFDDYHDDEICRPQEVYYPLYDYVSQVYYLDRVTADMTYDEAQTVANELWYRLSYDVPLEYELDEGYFYECFDRYYAELFE